MQYPGTRWWGFLPAIVVCGSLLALDVFPGAGAQTRPASPASQADTTSARVSIRGRSSSTSAADTLYRAARQAMAKGNTTQAISLFRRIASRHPKSVRAPSALYYQAFLQYQQYKPSADKAANPAVLRSALKTIARLERSYPKARQTRNARTLKTRICGELAARGDKACREQVFVAATRPMPAVTGGDTLGGKRHYFLFSPETPEVGPGQFYGMRQPNKAWLIPIDTTCRRQRELNEYVVALNSLWKIDTLKAIENTNEVLQMRNSCLARVREQAMLMLIRRPAPIQGLAPTVYEVARNDPDANVKRLATAWLLSQEWDPGVAKFLQTMFGQSFRVKSRK